MVESRDAPQSSLIAIIVCERVLREPDKAASLIRVVDQFNYNLPSQPQDVPTRIVFDCYVFTRWYLGVGTFSEQVALLDPNDFERPGGPPSVILQKEQEGYYEVVRRIHLFLDEAGQYKFRVYLDEEPRGEYPFQININVVGEINGGPNTS